MAGLFRTRGGVRARAVRDWLGLAAVVAAIAPGCGGSDGSPGPLASVSGRVLLANGKPLTRGRVTFVSKDASAPPASTSARAGRSTPRSAAVACATVE